MTRNIPAPHVPGTRRRGLNVEEIRVQVVILRAAADEATKRSNRRDASAAEHAYQRGCARGLSIAADSLARRAGLEIADPALLTPATPAPEVRQEYPEYLVTPTSPHSAG